MIDRYRDEAFATHWVHADAEHICKLNQAADKEWLYRIVRHGVGDHTARIWIVGVYEIMPDGFGISLIGWL